MLSLLRLTVLLTEHTCVTRAIGANRLSMHLFICRAQSLGAIKLGQVVLTLRSLMSTPLKVVLATLGVLSTQQ